MHHFFNIPVQFFYTLVLILLSSVTLYAQTASQQTYPRVAAYLSVSEPVGSLNNTGFHDNFSNGSTIIFPVGINLLKSDEFGISFEIAPAIRIEKGIAKTSSILFHPGTMFRFKHGFTFITRAAFESNGRFGFTPVFNQVIRRGKFCNYFVAATTPFRFGNDVPSAVGLNFQFGVAF